MTLCDSKSSVMLSKIQDEIVWQSQFVFNASKDHDKDCVGKQTKLANYSDNISKILNMKIGKNW